MLAMWPAHEQTSAFSHSDRLPIHRGGRGWTRIPSARLQDRASIPKQFHLGLSSPVARDCWRSLCATRQELGALAPAPLDGIPRRAQRVSLHIPSDHARSAARRDCLFSPSSRGVGVFSRHASRTSGTQTAWTESMTPKHAREGHYFVRLRASSRRVGDVVFFH